MSLRLNEKLDDRRLRGMVLHIHGDRRQLLAQPLSRPASRSSTGPFRGVPRGRRSGVRELRRVRGDLAGDREGRSARRARCGSRTSTPRSRRTATTRRSTRRSAMEQQFIAAAPGLTRHPTSFDDATFDEAASLAVITRDVRLRHRLLPHHEARPRVHLRALRGGAGRRAAGPARAARGDVDADRGRRTTSTTPLTLAALEPRARTAGAPGDPRRGAAKLARWADSCPGELPAPPRAGLRRDRAHRRPRARGRAPLRAGDPVRPGQRLRPVRGPRQRARRAFFRGAGPTRYADGYPARARACYVRWECDGKVKQLRSALSTAAPRRRRPARARPRPRSIAVLLEQLDLVSAVKASQTIPARSCSTS